MNNDTTITINESTSSAEEMAECLRYIAQQLDNGYTAGHSPSWILSVKEI